MHDVKHRPRDGVRREEVSEESTDVPQFVRLVPVDGVEILLECLLEVVGPDPVELAKPLADEAVEVRV